MPARTAGGLPGPGRTETRARVRNQSSHVGEGRKETYLCIAAAAPERMSADCTQSVGTEHASDATTGCVPAQYAVQLHVGDVCTGTAEGGREPPVPQKGLGVIVRVEEVSVTLGAGELWCMRAVRETEVEGAAGGEALVVTWMLGMAASTAGAPNRMSADWMQSVGTERASDDWMCAGSVGTGGRRRMG